MGLRLQPGRFGSARFRERHDHGNVLLCFQYVVTSCFRLGRWNFFLRDNDDELISEFLDELIGKLTIVIVIFRRGMQDQFGTRFQENINMTSEFFQCLPETCFCELPASACVDVAAFGPLGDDRVRHSFR